MGSQVDVSLPYGHSSLRGQIPDNVQAMIVASKPWPADSGSQQAIVKAALEKAIGTPMLRHLARNKRRVVIVTADKTRGVPSRITFPLILKELQAAGIRKSSVKLLVATGLHKGESISDLKERFGDEPLEGLEVIVHDSDDQSQLKPLGNLRTGTPLWLNSDVVDSDLVLLESRVEPHFFAGFTGGSKMILPGVAGTDTILRNHSYRNIDDPRSRYGVLDNPIRTEANEALSHIGKAFALNVVLDSEKRIVFANSGDPLSSFTSAANELSRHSDVEIFERPDLVLTSNGGYPLDRNLYQCVKGIAVPEQVVHKGSRIIMVGECSDGIGHGAFAELLHSGTVNEIYQRIRTAKATVCDQWEVQILCRILTQTPVWFVTRNELKNQVQAAHMQYASTIEEALDSAKLTRDERILAVPEGPSTTLKLAH